MNEPFLLSNLVELQDLDNKIFLINFTFFGTTGPVVK